MVYMTLNLGKINVSINDESQAMRRCNYSVDYSAMFYMNHSVIYIIINRKS
jgi:hypothetical protein